MKRLAVVVGFAWVFGLVPSGDAAAQEKIFSRQKAFRIPFQIPDPSEQKQLQEVQLYVARNGGKWEKYTSAPPDLPKEKCSFTFRADQDGEYWFAVRTMDKRGVQNPEDDANLQPGLRVVVDSDVPKVTLRPASRGREIGVEWEVQDRNLVLDSLKLEYRIEGQENWQPVPGVVPKFVGQAMWVPDSPGLVTVRCQVEDRAKNLGIGDVELEGVAAAGRPATAPWDKLGSTGSTPREESPTGTIDRFGSPSTLPRGTGIGSRPDTMPGGSFGEQRPSGISSEGDYPSAGDGAPSKTPSGDFARSTRSAGGTKPANCQLVRNPEISLDYTIEDEGPSGVSIVELWVTMDMGRTWQRVGEDPDRRSPFQVNLGDDGIFGLTLVAKSGVGLGDRPPAPGDQPQSWVEVDAAPPHLQVFTPEIGKGSQAGSVTITWSAEDSNLGDRCITLLYTDGARGDWKTIASAIENTGRHVWRIDGQVPYKFRVAVEVTDLAGNRTMQESSEITVDTSKPRPRISSINSGSSSRR
jgi:hypothetical protein